MMVAGVIAAIIALGLLAAIAWSLMQLVMTSTASMALLDRIRADRAV